MLLGFNDSKCTAYTVDSARGLIVIRTHLVLANGKLVLQKKPCHILLCSHLMEPQSPEILRKISGSSQILLRCVEPA